MMRTLADTLVDVATAVLPAPDEQDVVHVTRLDLDLPMHVWLVRRDNELTLLADVPAWRWSTAFDRRPGRLHVSCGLAAS